MHQAHLHSYLCERNPTDSRRIAFSSTGSWEYIFIHDHLHRQIDERTANKKEKPCEKNKISGEHLSLTFIQFDS